MTNDGGWHGTPLERRRGQFFSRFPKAGLLDHALRGPDNPTPLFFMSEIARHTDLKEVGFAITRLGPDLERQYLINGEVAVFFAPWKDFQRRSYNAMTLGLQSLSRTLQGNKREGERFTPSSKLVILVSEDSQVDTKVDEWQQDSTCPTLVIPVAVASDDPGAVLRELQSQLRSRLGDRDLYRTQNPVTGDDFFGRQAMLTAASAAIESDENLAILGLRRSGKTSVLRELKRQLLARGTIVTLGDFQVLDGDSVQTLATSIARNLVDDLRDARARGISVRVGDDKEQRADAVSLAELADRIKRTANRNVNFRFVLAIDEVESAARIAKSDPNQVRTLLGALRSAAQACPNVSLIFAGVANRMFRTTVLGAGENAVDNPMFGQVSSMYITSFSADETGDLLRKLGRPMFLDWSDEAVDAVQTATGGMPYFVRNLASAVRNHIRNDESLADFSMINVTLAHVSDVLPVWRADAGHDWSQLIDALALHYPEAADLLDASLSPAELGQWIASDGHYMDAAEDLSRLALLERSIPSGWSRTASLNSIHALLAERPISTALPPTSEEGLLALIRGGETQNLELKETFRINTHTGARDERMETEVVRAVAGLMNCDGGRVIVGVHDSGEVKGLARDLALFREDMDKFERWILGDLLGRRIDSALVSQLVRLSWVTARGVKVCVLEVSRSGTPAWLDDEHLHVRAGNQTLELIGRRLAQFLANRE